MTRHVLVLGGTARARRLAEELALCGVSVTYSLAGVVSRPAEPSGCLVRIGPFETGLVDWVAEQRIDLVVLATHPFAATIAGETRTLPVPVLALRGSDWSPTDRDDWHPVASPAEAVRVAERLGERVFLTVGRRGLAVFAASDRFFLVRTIEEPTPPLPARAEYLRARGPFDLGAETALLRRYRIDVLVTKDSGGEEVSAKLRAARELSVPVVLLRRPPPPVLPSVDSVCSAVRWVLERLSQLS